MTAEKATLSVQSRAVNRWTMAIVMAVGIVSFLLAHRSLNTDKLVAVALNDFSWWLASFLATYACMRVARQLSGREQTAWRILALASFCWWLGQTVWTYFEVWQGALPTFPHWMQALFAAYDWLLVGGLLLLPKPPGALPFTPRHGGNLALIVCTLLVTFIVGLLEPALMPGRNSSSNIVIALHCVGLASMFITALYLLWSYRWQALYWPLVLIVLGAGLHTATYITYIHQLLTQTYVPNDWFNVSWLFVFGAYACAAHERQWQKHNRVADPVATSSYRERWLEALIPALLIATMLAIVWLYSDWLSARAAGWTTIVALAFAAVLGLREAWIQRQEQRLLATLSGVNDSMLLANRELSTSESRYRSLSADLEQRVTDRTRELQQAYRELENFSYAAAHDLKAPLRSVDGFGAMLAEEYGERLDDKGRAYLQRMRRSALKMSELIDDLLAYARVERRQFDWSTVPLRPLIDKVIAEQRDEMDNSGVQLQVDVAPLSVQADSEGLIMACRNLLQNAIKFSRQAKPAIVSISATEKDNGVCIAITDNGIGFDMSYHERIFEVFQRLHRAEEIPGTGIGLAIVRKAVERMGGRVWAVSSPGAGATFYLHIPNVGTHINTDVAVS
jgi:signal transduction histidine kinase